MGRKWGLCPIFWGGGAAGSPSSTMWPGPRLASVPSGILMHPAVWPQWKWAENWGLRPLYWGRAPRTPSSTMWPGPRPTSMPSAILIHPAVWPQQTWAENCGVSPFWGGELSPHLA